ncbi:MAG: LytTR family DNA-binding domain-containing protein [Bacteroidales bacterium]|nr:LytTR family DNA-binding domain-containing protein [Bacteroidales bacterium]
MKVIIIEDERAAVRDLIVLLKEVKPDIEIVKTLDSITASVEWFSEHAMPDLLFMDISLADGLVFKIFEHVKITCPVIFTTAYDEYALRAFKVNSIDYLLKPISKEDIGRAFDKLGYFRPYQPIAYSYEEEMKKILRAINKEKNYLSHFLIPVKGDKLLPVSTDMILLFYIRDGIVKVVLTDGKEYTISQTLDELSECLDPNLFFRVNRQFLISRDAIQDIDLWFNNRLSVNLRIVDIKEKVLISKVRVSEFKEWFTKS